MIEQSYHCEGRPTDPLTVARLQKMAEAMRLMHEAMI